MDFIPNLDNKLTGMKIFLIFATLVGFIVSAHAQTTITVNGQAYDVYTSTGTYDSLEATLSTNLGNDELPWWTGNSTGSSTLATNFADTLDQANVRFAYKVGTFLSTDIAYYSTNATTDIAAQTESATYAVRAVAVPAPLPILGILPVVGFLKRMRRRQKAS